MSRYIAERLNCDSYEWEHVGVADSEAQALALRPEGDWAEYRVRPAPTLRELAEKVVDEIKADMDPDKDSEYNMAPYPDPVGALVAFAEVIRESL